MSSQTFTNRTFIKVLHVLESLTRAISQKLYWKIWPRLAEEMSLVYAGPDSANLRFYVSGAEVYYRATRVLTKEPDTIAWIDGFGDGEVLWDIGANVGVYSLYAAARKRAKVVAFEPSFFNFSVLCRNIQLNGVEDLVIPMPFALAESNAIGMLNLSGSGAMPGGAGNSFGEAIDNGGKLFQPSARMAVPGISCDAAAEVFQVPLPTRVKIDIDGNQLQVLRGMTGLLRHPGLTSIMFETMPSRPAEAEACHAILTEAGWQVAHTHSTNTYYARAGA